MKYYLCKVGSFQDGGEDVIIKDCIDKNVYQYHEVTRQKGAGGSIASGDTLILVYKTQILAYGIAEGKMEKAGGYEPDWLAVPVKRWIKIAKGENLPLPYGVFWHTLTGNKQSVVKEVDALWANEIILQITLKNSTEMNTATPALYLHLSTIAAFYQHELISVPAVQRGKVWNAVRCEVLWDSLLRGIPVGSLSIRMTKTNWELFDGQQRVNAINMGFEPFPSENDENDRMVLWIDIATLQLNSGDEVPNRKSERKFFFRVTTPAHPWGYKLSEDETRNTLLPTWERKAAVEKIKWDSANHPGGRPKTFELWPVDAKLPVPFSILRGYCERNPNGSFDEFWIFCQGAYGTTNWVKQFDECHEKNELFESARHNWREIAKAVDNMSSYVIVAQNSATLDDRDIGLYFRRLNKAGIVPGDDEIRYSLLKSIIPDLKKLDKLAENHMPPAVLANIAMMSYLTLSREKWINSLSFSDVKNLANDKDFCSYILGGRLKNLMGKIESWLLYSGAFQNGLPRCLYSSIAKSGQRDLYRLLLFFASKWEDLDKEQLVAVVTLVCWYSDECGKMVSRAFDLYSKCESTQDAWNRCTRQWITESSIKGLFVPPQPVSAYAAIGTAPLESILSRLDSSVYAQAIKRTWGWDMATSRALLLYACREYLNRKFPDYDSAQVVWHEENRPWDYDHIFPHSWLISGRGNKQGPYNKVVAKFINSIGNIAPIHFSTNRSKNDECPGTYQRGDNAKLFIDYDNNQIFFSTSLKGCLEKNPEDAGQLVKITMRRLERLYEEWYKTLAIDSFFDFMDRRRELFESIKSKLDGNKVGVYFTCGERQYECKCKADWSRPKLAVGVDTGRDFVAVASDGETIELGFRRRPEESSIKGENIWYRNNKYCTDYKFEDHDLDEKLVEKLKELIELSKQAKDDIKHE